jgi:hypothetical protein
MTDIVTNIELSITHRDFTGTKNYICEYECDKDGKCNIYKSHISNILNFHDYGLIMDALENNSKKFCMKDIKGYVITDKMCSEPNIFIKNKNDTNNGEVYMINKDSIRNFDKIRQQSNDKCLIV